MDLIVELPPSNDFDAIFIYMDHLTKMTHFIPTTSNITAEQVAVFYTQ
jgi:hypothetical protein